MISADAALRELMKDVGKALRPLGYKGSGTRWRRIDDAGMAEVSRWSRAMPDPEGQVRRFGLVGRAVPVEWWRYESRRARRYGQEEIPLERGSGPQIVDHDYPRRRPACVWNLPLDTARYPAELVREDDVEAVREQLSQPVEALGRAMIRLAEPGRYLEALRDEPNKSIGDWTAMVVLAAEHGEPGELDEAIARLSELLDQPGDEKYLSEVIADARA